MAIPPKLLEDILQDPWYEKCCYANCQKNREQLHHVFKYGKASIQKKFSIVPVCVKHHEWATPHNNKYRMEAREYFEWVSIRRMTNADVLLFPKKNWSQEAFYLNNKYGKKRE